MGHYVYKYVLNDEIIYIGKNDTNLHSRLAQHGKAGDNIPSEAWDDINKSDIFYCTLANSTMSDVVESELIRRYKPKYNSAKKSKWSGLPFVEPKWKKYKPKKKQKVNSYSDEKLKRMIKAHNNNTKALEIIKTLKERIENKDYKINETSFGEVCYEFEMQKTDTNDGTYVICYRGNSVFSHTLISECFYTTYDNKYYYVIFGDYFDVFDMCLNIIDLEREEYEKFKDQISAYEKRLAR